jgi:hypothetical protein
LGKWFIVDKVSRHKIPGAFYPRRISVAYRDLQSYGPCRQDMKDLYYKEVPVEYADADDKKYGGAIDGVAYPFDPFVGTFNSALSSANKEKI